ncbi:hypothetical protein [Oceanobacillus piezotolerans]|uniref:hypothetical protein n=1 Tax=Oceanobacillus piezotolerans TaxID=2448030 RepID=UPI001313ECE8|nr:hypothetical protein [Oceanobacillus piezotolerans]
MAVNLRKYTAKDRKPVTENGNNSTKNGSERILLLGTIFYTILAGYVPASF